MRLLLLLPFVAVTSCGVSAWSGPPQVPEGFTVELVAGYPLVEHPMMACFDDRGRLYLCESAGTNRPARELLEDPRDSIRVLEDTNGDGVFDRSWTFADRLVFPQGCLWHEGALYTCSPPSLWKLEDTTGDGVCDRRTELVSSFGFNGNAADIHGPFLSPDGRLYWCDGRHGHEFFDEQGALVSRGRAARIFSCLPDGSDVQVLCGGGMDNPVEVDFWETGEVIGTCNLFYSDPRGDCLVHWVPGGVYPRVDQQDCIAEFPWTGRLLDPIHNYGHVAVSGLTRYRSGAFELPPAVDETGHPWPEQVTFFVTQFNTHKLVRTIVARSGASFRVLESQDFLVSEDPDFHPTDVLEAPDGSLLVIDTGGWFRIGCPTSQIAKPEIAGAIYRIRQTGTPGPGPEQRLTNEAGGREPVLTALDDLPLLVDQPHRLLQALGELAERHARARTNGAASTVDRIAVEAERPHAVAALLELLPLSPREPVLEHAFIYALIEISDASATRVGLQHPDARVRRAALIALDQMESGQLTRDEVLPLLDTPDSVLQQTVLEVISRRQGWSDGVVSLFEAWLQSSNIDEERLAILRLVLTARASEASVQKLIDRSLEVLADGNTARRTLLEVMESALLHEWPSTWSTRLNDTLRRGDEFEQLLAVRVIAAHGRSEFDGLLTDLASGESAPPVLRVDAFAAAASRIEAIDPSLMAFLIQRLSAEEASISEKLRIISGLRQVAGLTPSQASDLAGRLHEFGPTVAGACLPLFEGLPHVGPQLIASLRELGVSPSLSIEVLESLVAGYPDAVRREAEPLLEQLRQMAGDRSRRIDELLPQVEGGDVDRGRYVFFSQRAACSACHRVQSEGTRIGPDLTTIGTSRTSRDLLESILYPSSSFARGYEPYVLATSSGLIHAGIIIRETPDSLVLRTSDLREVRVRRSEVEELRPGDVSIMPAGLEERLTPQELRDLLAFLQNLR